MAQSIDAKGNVHSWIHPYQMKRERCTCGTYSRPGGFEKRYKGKCMTCYVIWQAIYKTLEVFPDREYVGKLSEADIQTIFDNARASAKETNAERGRRAGVTAKRNAVAKAIGS